MSGQQGFVPTDPIPPIAEAVEMSPYDLLMLGPVVLDKEATRRLDEIIAQPSGPLPESPVPIYHCRTCRCFDEAPSETGGREE